MNLIQKGLIIRVKQDIPELRNSFKNKMKSGALVARWAHIRRLADVVRIKNKVNSGALVARWAYIRRLADVVRIKIYCGVEQLVARWAHNPKVVGSSPAPATKFSLSAEFECDAQTPFFFLLSRSVTETSTYTHTYYSSASE